MTNNPCQPPFRQRPRLKRKDGQFRQYKERRPSSDFSALIDAIKSEGRSYRSEEKREDTGKKFREWVTIILVGLTFIAICYQVHEMIKVYDPIKDQAVATEKAAEATIRTANAATDQSKIATRQVE